MRYNLFIIVSLLALFSFSQTNNPACSNSISGKIVNSQSKQIIPNARVSLVYSGKVVSFVNSDSEGQYSFSELECNKRYRIVVVKENFLEAIQLIFTLKTIAKHYEVNVNLIPAEEFTERDSKTYLILNEIDFYPDSFDLTKEAKIELNRVYRILYKYPWIRIEISFHSDSRGQSDFLMELTNERAEVCRSYLTNKGIDPTRIEAKGYGDSQLLNHCKKGIKCSNKQHLQNRRSEFIVLVDKEK